MFGKRTRKQGRNGSEGVARRLGLNRPLRRRSYQLSLISYGARKIGGKEVFLQLAACSQEICAQKAVNLWQKLSRSDRRYVSLDDLCEAAGVDESALIKAVVAAGEALGYDMDTLEYARLYQFLGEEESFKRAMRDGGFRDRFRILKRTGRL